MEIWPFSFFQDGGRPPSWIFKRWKFQLLIPFGGPNGVIVPNFVQIGQGGAEICPFLIFQDRGHPPSWICYTPIWTTQEVYFGGLCHCAKFGLNRCSIFDNMQVLLF